MDASISAAQPINGRTGTSPLGGESGPTGSHRERPLPAEFRAFSGSLVDPGVRPSRHRSNATSLFRPQSFAMANLSRFVFSSSSVSLVGPSLKVSLLSLPLKRNGTW